MKKIKAARIQGPYFLRMQIKVMLMLLCATHSKKFNKDIIRIFSQKELTNIS